MQRFLLYVFLVIIYLGLAKLISPSEYGVQYLPNNKDYEKIFPQQNVSAILIDIHATGFLIKTYYQKYRVITGPTQAEDVIVRTSKDFAKKNKQNIGMSLFRKMGGVTSVIPLPPGAEFIGNENFGEWVETEGKNAVWTFHRPFKNLVRYFGWGDFQADKKFHEDLKVHLLNEKAYYGNNSQFGFNGSITKINFPHFFSKERQKKMSLDELMVLYFKQKF
jgi:hypothetical protein